MLRLLADCRPGTKQASPDRRSCGCPCSPSSGKKYRHSPGSHPCLREEPPAEQTDLRQRCHLFRERPDRPPEIAVGESPGWSSTRPRVRRRPAKPTRCGGCTTSESSLCGFPDRHGIPQSRTTDDGERVYRHNPKGSGAKPDLTVRPRTEKTIRDQPA